MTGVKVCMDCFYWMTRLCPRERHENGWKKGPASSDLACDSFKDKREKRDVEGTSNG